MTKSHFFCLELAFFKKIWCVFTFSTQFLSGWWTLLRELTKKKKCILVFWESSTDSTNICSAIVKRHVTDHVLMLATTSWVTHLIFLFLFVCFVWSSLLGLSVAVILRHQDFPHVATDPLVCVPSWSNTFSYLANYFFCFVSFFLRLQHRPTSYLFLNNLRTSSQFLLPPPCSCLPCIAQESSPTALKLI